MSDSSEFSRRNLILLAAAGAAVTGVADTAAAADIGPEVVVDGERIWDQPYLQTEKLTFKPGGVLRFTRKGVMLGGGRIAILARMIECQQANPGKIEYEKVSLADATGLTKALPGQSFDPSGNGDNSVGRAGANGNSGVPGIRGNDGSDAPTLELWTLGISGVGPVIDFRGQDGKKGGPGQEGGDGGNGEKGTHGRGGVFECHAGGGDGGKGGDGGRGGDGGQGGNGGKGGVVLVMGPTQFLSDLTAKTRVLVAGGQSGPGGDPGAGGQFGVGGEGGQGEGLWCKDEKDNRRGPNGNAGQVGSAGKPGASGFEGITVGVPVTKEAFENRLASGSNPNRDPRLDRIKAAFDNR